MVYLQTYFYTKLLKKIKQLLPFLFIIKNVKKILKMKFKGVNGVVLRFQLSKLEKKC